MKRLEPELPEERQILRELRKQHGDMLPGSLAALEAISGLFKGFAPVNVYWFYVKDWNHEDRYQERVHEVALNYNKPETHTFHILSNILHEVQPRKFRRLSAFVPAQQRRLSRGVDVLEPTPFLLRKPTYHGLLHESIYRRHYQAMTCEIKLTRAATPTIYSVQDIFFNLEYRRVYLMLGEADDNTLEE